jgi:hypothetical protein
MASRTQQHQRPPPSAPHSNKARPKAAEKEITSDSLGGLIYNNSGGLIQGTLFGVVWIWGPSLSWWQWVLAAMVGYIVMLYFKQSSMLYARTPPGMPKTPADNPPSYRSPAEHGIKHEVRARARVRASVGGLVGGELLRT